MGISTPTNALKLIREILDRTKTVEPVLAPRVQKPPFPGLGGFRPLARANPAQCGLDSALLSGYLRELFADPRTRTHTAMILKDGAVVAQTAAYPYSADVWRITHSLCKSLTGLAVGILEGEGRLDLDARAYSFFDRARLPLLGLRARAITVRHLLTMSSGVLFNEAGSVTDEDWIRAFFDSIPAFEPGSRFLYNSMNTYLLGAIVRQVAGESLLAFLTPRVLEPLGFGSCHWETCPAGLEKGGMGLYLLPEDMAKLGQLYLNRGRWQGMQLVPEDWCTRAVSAQIETPDSVGLYDYGYQVWVRKGANFFALNGMFGQNVLVFPQSGIVVAVTAGNDDMFQKNPFFEITERWFRDLRPRATRPGGGALHRLRALEREIAAARPAPRGARRRGTLARLRALDGVTLVFAPGEAIGVGLLPLLVQAIENNHTKGLTRLTFSLDGETLWATFAEQDEAHRIPIGMWGEAIRSQAEFHGECYALAASGQFVPDGEGGFDLCLDLVFLELPNRRRVRISFRDGGQAIVRLFETPGVEFVRTGAASLLDSVGDGRLVESAGALIRREYPPYVLREVFEPEAAAAVLTPRAPVQGESAPPQG